MLQSVLLFVLCAGTVISGLSYYLYWREALRSPHWSHSLVSSGRAGLAACVFKAFVVSVLSQVFTYCAYPAGWISPAGRPAAMKQGRRPPVVLVHGLYHNASAWYVFRWMLQRAGYDTVVAWSYNSARGDFWAIVPGLRAEVARVAAACGGERVMLVGHSLGGLLARAAVDDPACAARVRAMVCLGSPHGGSVLASLALGKLGRSIAPDGELVARMRTLRAPASMPKLNIFSPLDNMVLPTAALEISGPGWLQQETAPISHVSMLYNLHTLRQALDFMDEAAGCGVRHQGEALAGA